MISDTHRYINLRTFRKSGAAVDTPVWFAQVTENHYVCYSAGDAGKVKRLRNSSQAEVALCDYAGKLQGPWLQAEALLVMGDAEISQAYTLLRAKYGWQIRMLDFVALLSGRIKNRQVIQFSLIQEET